MEESRSVARRAARPRAGLIRRGVVVISGLGLVAGALAACSSSKPSNSGAAPSAEAGSSGHSAVSDFVAALGKPANSALCSGKKYTFGYDTFSDTDAFAVALYKGLQSYAHAMGCVTIKKLVDGANAATAVQNANIFVQQHVNGAILFNVVQAASQGQAQVLDAAHIPIVSLAVPVTGKPFITNKDSADGKEGGVALGKAYLAKHTSGPVYAILGRYDGQDSTKQRMDGASAGLTQTVPGVHILPIDSKADAPTAQSATTTVLAKIPSNATILLIGVNDDVTYAMVQAVKQAGRISHAIAVGIGGANPTGLGYVCKNPVYAGVVEFFPENWPSYLVPALLGEIHGAAIPVYPKETVVATKVITAATIKKYYPSFAC